MTQVTQEATGVVVTPEEDVVASNAQALRSTLLDLIQQGQQQIVIDIQHVAMVDSSGLGVFIAAQNSLKGKGGQLRVINASPDVLRLFQVMRLDRHFAVDAR